MRPDFIDVEQLMGRLGIDRSNFRSLQQRGAAPDPDLHFDGNPLWWWERVEHWSKQRRRLTRRVRFGKKLPEVDLVDIDAVGRRLGVTRKVAERWRQRGTLPEPDYAWGFGEAWLWSTITEWSDDRRVARPVTPVEPPAPTETGDPLEQAPSLDELDALVARLEQLEDSLDDAARPPADDAGRETELLHQRMADVADFIGRLDR